MEQVYPDIKTIEENLEAARRLDYRIVGFLFFQKRVGGKIIIL
jgi:hypothetical protein